MSRPKKTHNYSLQKNKLWTIQVFFLQTLAVTKSLRKTLGKCEEQSKSKLSRCEVTTEVFICFNKGLLCKCLMPACLLYLVMKNHEDKTVS